jgi:5-methylcytosine-specific restriction enzyme A
MPKRHPDWPRIKRAHQAKFPRCWNCGLVHDCQVHHLLPFHLFPNLELDPTNLLTLGESIGRNCHLQVGHLGDWQDYNESLVLRFDVHLDRATSPLWP